VLRLFFYEFPEAVSRLRIGAENLGPKGLGEIGALGHAV